MGIFYSKNKPEERIVTKAKFNPYKYDIAIFDGKVAVKNKKNKKLSILEPQYPQPSTSCLFLVKGDDAKYDPKKDAYFHLVKHDVSYSLYEPVYSLEEEKDTVEITLANKEKKIVPKSEFIKYTYKNQPLSELKNGDYDVLIRDGASYRLPDLSVWQKLNLVFKEHGAECGNRFFSYYMTLFALPGTFTE